MEREIKFRAWDEETEEMLYSDKDYGRCTFVCESEGILKCYVPEEVPATRDEPSHLVGRELHDIMQFTGLKDKNGKEICEGDIVEMNPVDDEWNAVVVWWGKQARFELKSFVCYPNRVTNCQLAEHAAAHKGNNNPCIIIGNIHDNPELMEK